MKNDIEAGDLVINLLMLAIYFVVSVAISAVVFAVHFCWWK